MASMTPRMVGLTGTVIDQPTPRRARVSIKPWDQNPESARRHSAAGAPARRRRATSSSTKCLAPRWLEPLRNRACSTSPVGAGRQQRVVAERAGETVWEEPLGDLPAVVAGIDGMVVVLSGDELRSYDAGDGTPVWTEAVPVVDATPNQALVRSGNLLVTRGQLYLHTNGVWTVDPRTGETEPIATDGVLAVAVTRDYVVTAKGCCLEAQPPPD
jgi:outer membrane protein assembly factor BamB